MTETCEADQVHLITDVETTWAAAADVDQTAPIHAALAAKGLLPGDHRPLWRGVAPRATGRIAGS